MQLIWRKRKELDFDVLQVQTKSFATYMVMAYAVSIGCEYQGQVMAGALADVTRKLTDFAARAKMHTSTTVSKPVE